MKNVAEEKYMKKELIHQYIENNYFRDISLTEISEAFHFSSGYFCKYFKELTGSNLKDYLNSFRVSQAQKMILEDDKATIGDIAGRIGFNNYKTFARVFKRYSGISPEKYKKIYSQPCLTSQI
jgi:two-component system response regulator YesN